jgi:hypothetical protein
MRYVHLVTGLGEADLDGVAECQTHKIYLDTDKVPEHRKGNKYYTQEEALNG